MKRIILLLLLLIPIVFAQENVTTESPQDVPPILDPEMPEEPVEVPEESSTDLVVYGVIAANTVMMVILVIILISQMVRMKQISKTLKELRESYENEDRSVKQLMEEFKGLSDKQKNDETEFETIKKAQDEFKKFEEEVKKAQAQPKPEPKPLPKEYEPLKLYLTNNLKAGKSLEQMRPQLRASGWRDEIINIVAATIK